MSEAEIRHRINQVLDMSECVTMAMLSAFLTSRVTPKARDGVLTKMQTEGLLRIGDKAFRSITGHTSTAKVVMRTASQAKAPKSA